MNSRRPRLRGPNTQHYRIVSAVVEILANATVPLPPRLILKCLEEAGMNPFDWGDQHYREATLTTVLNLEVSYRMPVWRAPVAVLAQVALTRKDPDAGRSRARRAKRERQRFPLTPKTF